METRPAVLEFLHQVKSLVEKCELYWPASDQLFMDFPSEIHKPSNGLELLGLSVWDPDDFYDSCFASKVDIFINISVPWRMQLFLQNFSFAVNGFP